MEPAALERELCRIPEVTATRVVLDSSGVPSEIHILATPSKPAKQVVRDVQAVAMATFDVEVDRRIVSVVQLDSPAGEERARTEPDEPATAAASAAAELAAGHPQRNGTPAPGAEALENVIPASGIPASGGSSRVYLTGVSIARDGYRGTVEVTLSWDGAKAVGWESGSASTVSVHRQVALATLAALRQFDPAAERFDLETVTVTRLGERDVAAATLVMLEPPREEVLAGTAIVGATGVADALARAVLDALNRRLGGLRRPQA